MPVFLITVLLFFSNYILAQIPESLMLLHLVRSCSVLDIYGNVLKTLPGTLCVFLDDGSFISANDKTLLFFDHENTIKWEIKGFYHHQLNLSNDGKKILVMASEVSDKIRVDVFLVISLDGKILHQQKSDFLLKEKKLTPLKWGTTKWVKDNIFAETEISHFNSFYEIPEILGDRTDTVTKKGNFIVNGLNHGIFILSSDLKEILLHFVLNKSDKHNMHDVQVNSAGNFLLFNNHPDGSNMMNSFSSIVEYDNSKKTKVFEFTASPRSMFYSGACGGVQEVDADHLLFSDHFNGTFLYSKSKSKMIATIRSTHFQGGEHFPSQQIKAFNLSKFLESRKGR